MNQRKKYAAILVITTAAILSFFIHSLESVSRTGQTLHHKTDHPELNRLHNLHDTQEYFFTTGPQKTIQIGEDILRQGGNAVDAALASALARIVDDMGFIVSFAGIFMMVYYDAASEKTYSLNACFKTVKNELSPLTIPTYVLPNPRAVLVPGFMAGVQAAHERFGRLLWEEIFAPAIDLAENGFEISQDQIDNIQAHWNILGILPETRDIFLKRPYGLFRNYEPGDTFTQPALAHTLRQVASEGGDYMYNGEWGRKFVDTIRRLGGNMSMNDLEEYEPVWADPARTSYLDYELNALGYPSLGAMSVVLAVNLMECSGLAQYDHCSRSADALYRLVYCSRAGEFFYPPYAPEIIHAHIPEGDFSYTHRAEKRNAQLIWEKILSGDWAAIERDIALYGQNRPSHSEGIISVDREGNVAAVCHTINCENWGNTGIFIDGVSVPGAAFYQRSLVDKVGPGAYLPDTTNPLLVLQDGKPVIASTSIGSDMHSATVQNLYNLLHFNYSWSESRRTPKFQSVSWQGAREQKVQRNQFSQAILDAVTAMGMRFLLVDDWPSEYWIGWRSTDQENPSTSWEKDR